MKILSGLLALLLFASVTMDAKAEMITFNPADNERQIAAALHRPDAEGPVPLIVIAPGTGYDMDAPLMPGLADQANAMGIAALRFNWGPHHTELPDLANLSPYMDDLSQAIDLALAHDGIDASRLIIAGKSLGSIVGWVVFGQRSTAIGALLFTPICMPQAPLLQTYPGLLDGNRPVALIPGDQDPLCPMGLYREAVSTVPDNVTSIIVPGDHVYFPAQEGGDALSDQDKFAHPSTLENIDEIVAKALAWAATIVTKP